MWWRSLLTCPPLFPVLASRLRWKHVSSLEVANEPILAFTQGSPERGALQKVREGGGAHRVQGMEQRWPQQLPRCFSVPTAIALSCPGLQPWGEPWRLGRAVRREGGRGWEHHVATGASVQVRGHEPTDVLCFTTFSHSPINCQYFKNYEISRKSQM